MRKIKNVIKTSLNLLPFSLRIKLIGLIKLGYKLDLRSPKTFNEKINYRKFKALEPMMTICSDKYLVRNFVAERIGKKYLIPLLYVGETITEADIRNISCDCVIKTTHDSGTVFLLKSGDNIKISTLLRSINRSLNFDFGKYNDEPWYSEIKPKVLVEKMLKNSNGVVPDDYKFHVFNNKNNDLTEVILQVDYDRFTNHTRSFYDESGRLLTLQNKYPINKSGNVKKIENLDLMFDLAKNISSDFSYVRVDLYNLNGDIFFGELTFAHETGFGRFNDYDCDLAFGKKWSQNETHL